MQIVSTGDNSTGDNLHEPSNHVSGKNKKNIIHLLSAELAQSDKGKICSVHWYWWPYQLGNSIAYLLAEKLSAMKLLP